MEKSAVARCCQPPVVSEKLTSPCFLEDGCGPLGHCVHAGSWRQRGGLAAARAGTGTDRLTPQIVAMQPVPHTVGQSGLALARLAEMHVNGEP